MRSKPVWKIMITAVIGVYISFGLMPIIIMADTKTNGYLLTEANAEPEMAPFYWMVLIVGGIIAATLAYVSWRKYRGEKKKQMNNDSNS